MEGSGIAVALSRLPGGPSKCNDLHRRLTVRAPKDRAKPWCDSLNHDLQHKLYECQQLFCIAVQEAVVSDTTKAFGQDVLQNEPQEIFAFQGAVAGFAGAAFGVLESDGAVFIRNDIVFTDDASV